jgi:hypothetical protein
MERIGAIYTMLAIAIGRDTGNFVSIAGQGVWIHGNKQISRI